jgi:TetR/AcrR family transcriptional regulator
MIWASTQHYADFDHQVNILNDHQPLSDMQFERAVQTVTGLILRGIGLEPKRVSLSHALVLVEISY